MDQGLTVEILDDGRGGQDPRRYGSWPARHRRRSAVVGAVALLGAVFAAVRAFPQDPWPTLVVVPVHGPSDAPALWRAGADGRPVTSVSLTVAAVVRQVPTPGASPPVVRVLGLTGPGISPEDGPPVAVPTGGREVGLPLRAAVDCAEVPEVAPSGAYGLRIEVDTRSGPRRGVVPAGAVGEAWGSAVQLGCATWAARRALTVTNLTMRVHPTRPRLDLTLTVANSGDREATLDRAAGEDHRVRVGGPLPLRIPAHRSVTARMTTDLTSCDTIGYAVPRDGGRAVL
ncbi:MAG TPA: hypothetical protein VI248_14590, partial [Kineosporiaceae bacterium]